MRHRLWAGMAVLAAGCATVGTDEHGGVVAPEAPPPAPRIALAEVGDSVVYLEQTDAFTGLARSDGDTLVVSSRHDAVIHVLRTAPDTLVGFYEHLRLRFRSGNQTRDIETDSILWQRFVMHEDDGRIETLSTPSMPAEVRQLTELERQFDDFFLRLPDRPIVVGAEWVDTVRFGETGPGEESSIERLVVSRYRVARDTVVHDIPARVIEYTSVLESTVRSAPSTQGRMTSALVGEEQGRFVFAPDRELMLHRHRTGVLEGELVVEGNLDTQRLPQTFSYESRIELVPPLPPDTVATPREPEVEIP